MLQPLQLSYILKCMRQLSLSHPFLNGKEGALPWWANPTLWEHWFTPEDEHRHSENNAFYALHFQSKALRRLSKWRAHLSDIEQQVVALERVYLSERRGSAGSGCYDYIRQILAHRGVVLTNQQIKAILGDASTILVQLEYEHALGVALKWYNRMFPGAVREVMAEEKAKGYPTRALEFEDGYPLAA